MLSYYVRSQIFIVDIIILLINSIVSSVLYRVEQNIWIRKTEPNHNLLISGWIQNFNFRKTELNPQKCEANPNQNL